MSFTQSEIQQAINAIEDNNQRLITPQLVREPLNRINETIFWEECQIFDGTIDQGITIYDSSKAVITNNICVINVVFAIKKFVPAGSRPIFIRIPFDIEETESWRGALLITSPFRSFNARRQSSTFRDVIGIYNTLGWESGIRDEYLTITVPIKKQ